MIFAKKTRVAVYLLLILSIFFLGCSVQTDVGTDSKKIDGNLTVHFIDVGQGASQLIIGPTGKAMLIDGGDNDDEERMVEYLKKYNIKKIDILIGTHPDADHIGGLDAVVDHFDVGQIYMPKIQADTKTFESLLLAIKRKGLKVNTAKAGLVLDWEEAVTVQIISPVKESNDRNKMSAVVHLAFGERSFLFTGDAERENEEEMMKAGYDVESDVMLIAHHGSNSSTSEAFLEQVNPQYAVIQVGADNRYGHPTELILNRLQSYGVDYYRTDLDGTIILTSDGKTINVKKEK